MATTSFHRRPPVRTSRRADPERGANFLDELQRRLITEGTSFREVLDSARREVALETIARGGAMTTVTV